ncbi:translation initiation factor IF-3 [Paenibacillus gansuensis]|uniref:Translation initiation factor IF-3 n=1 Tax=Paenibacillus gansuensis TaxID=306542 RepID=A0ABW5PIT5_9BACL
MIMMNEKIKASEVLLTGLNGEVLGIMPTSEALALARIEKADLVCTSLMSSPPPCKLMGRGQAKAEAQQERKKQVAPKVKEIRLTPAIEEHDYDTKKGQAERLLTSGDQVLLVVKLQGKQQDRAKQLLETMIKDLRQFGKPQTGLQISGKQASAQLEPN